MKRLTIRAVAVTAALLIILCSIPVVTVLAKWENTHVNTGNEAADVVAIARTQIGYHGGKLDGTGTGTSSYLTKYGVWYDNTYNGGGGTFRDAYWCAMFVSWCGAQAGIPSSRYYPHASCTTGMNWYKNKGWFHYSSSRGGSYTPKAGDIIYYNFKSTTTKTECTHVGIVEYVSGDRVYTIEGNTSSADYDASGNCCADKNKLLTNSYIVGYGSPNYVTDINSTSAEKLGTYITTDALNVRKGAGTSYDKIGMFNSGDMAVITELSGSWGKTTIDGQTGWCNIGSWGNYIGMDALASPTVITDGLSYSYNANGSMVLTNNSTGRGVIDLALPVRLGTLTTPYLNCQIAPISGGFFFGLTQANSGYFMMRDCSSSSELVVEDSAPYMTNMETLEINVANWWKPTAGYRINTVRVYLQPHATVRVNYFYFAAESGKVTSTTYNTMKSDEAASITLMDPSKLDIYNRAYAGSYSYNNGTLTVTSDTASGFSTVFNLNKEYTPVDMPKLLVSISSDVRFNISFMVTASDGDRWFTLGDDFFNQFDMTAPGTYVPATSKTATFDFLGCYTWNNILPSSGVSTIKKVRIDLGGQGSATVSAIQMSSGETIRSFADGVQKSDSSTGNVVNIIKGDVTGDEKVNTADVRSILKYVIGGGAFTDTQQKAGDYNNDNKVDTLDVRQMLTAISGNV
ncbi:MAG: CHAP domain-containing protein [Clostridia bacterium]|nr:CHAP domain-containing protein [Clostridia bacterium]